MVRKLIVAVVVLGLIGLAGFYFLTIPHSLAASDLPDHKPDLANGEHMFFAGGCESCHAAPASDKCDDKAVKDQKVLAGGRCLGSPFGTFYVPNISPDPEHGIGKWQLVDFVNAMKFGVGPGGTHLYPAFPYPSYQHMKLEDLIDLKGYLDTLPASANVVRPHDVPFPFSFRRGLGLWKLLYVDGHEVPPVPNASSGPEPGRLPRPRARALQRVPFPAQLLRRDRREPRPSAAGRRRSATATSPTSRRTTRPESANGPRRTSRSPSRTASSRARMASRSMPTGPRWQPCSATSRNSATRIAPPSPRTSRACRRSTRRGRRRRRLRRPAEAHAFRRRSVEARLLGRATSRELGAEKCHGR